MEFYTAASVNRYNHIGRHIDETLEKNAVGILFAREGHRVQFPKDVDVFNIYPPALDDLNRWLREYSQMGPKNPPKGATEQPS